MPFGECMIVSKYVSPLTKSRCKYVCFVLPPAVVLVLLKFSLKKSFSCNLENYALKFPTLIIALNL